MKEECKAYCLVFKERGTVKVKLKCLAPEMTAQYSQPGFRLKQSRD